MERDRRVYESDKRHCQSLLLDIVLKDISEEIPEAELMKEIVEEHILNYDVPDREVVYYCHIKHYRGGVPTLLIYVIFNKILNLAIRRYIYFNDYHHFIYAYDARDYMTLKLNRKNKLEYVLYLRNSNPELSNTLEAWELSSIVLLLDTSCINRKEEKENTVEENEEFDKNSRGLYNDVKGCKETEFLNLNL